MFLEFKDYFTHVLPISDDKKAYYDFSFTIESAETEDAEGFLLMGAKNKNGTNLVWNNNNTTVTDEEDK